MTDHRLPFAVRRDEAFARYPVGSPERLALEAGHMLLFPRSYITSKGAVDWSRLRRAPPVSLAAALIGLPLIGKTEAELAALVLAEEAAEQRFWAERRAAEPSRQTKQVNTLNLLASLGDLRL